MAKQAAVRVVWVGFLLALFALTAVHPATAEATNRPVESAVPASTMVEETRYAAYGFTFEQYQGHERYGSFAERELEVLGAVIVAFAELAGGPERLHALVDGPVRVRRDLLEVVSYTQAGRVIGLGRAAFDLALTVENNYYTWGAESGDELAQIVFGHEIGHRWIEALRRESDVDWGAKYAQNVWRGERPSRKETWDLSGATSVSPEEEAVTNLALAALGKRYRWTFLHDAPAKERRQVWVDGWVSDLQAASEPN
jgi:hypothetical protein